MGKIFKAGKPHVEPIGWTVKEYELRKAKNDPFIGLLEKEGIVIEERNGMSGEDK